MNENQTQSLDDLTLAINFDLAILNSAVKDGENLEICMLEDFVEKIYQTSKEVREIFENQASRS